ncbi:MAG: SUMF1/EgtB/PvdO family nonheme iron enzyme [Cyanobacteriota bacterium]|nr:SUMF1/EgtB/PvdO family nonheme iron enzyme [Cyanobacteriota bacterium]
MDAEACKRHVANRWQDLYGKESVKPNQQNARSKHSVPPSLKKLDALLEELRDKVRQNFRQKRKREQKHIYVPLKATMHRPGSGEEQGQLITPGPEDLAGIFEHGNQLVLIWQEGGAGKTSLAFEMASWCLDPEKGSDWPHQLLLPFFLEFSRIDISDPAKPLTWHVGEVLSRLRGVTVPETDVKLMLQHKRLLLIVDHFSELTDEQQKWLEKNLEGIPNLILLLTSRLGELSQTFDEEAGWTVTKIKPERLKDQELNEFFDAYLRKRGSDVDGKDGGNPLLDHDDITRTRELLERMVGNQPITVLLAWMVIEKAIQHVRERRQNGGNEPMDVLPSSIPELMEDYVKNSGKLIDLNNRWLKDQPAQEPEWVLACMKAIAWKAHGQGQAFQPTDFGQPLALSALAHVRLAGKTLATEQQETLLPYLVEKLTLVQLVEPSKPLYRLALDPLADYLAALAQLDLWNQQQGSGNPEAEDQLVHRVRAWVQGWLDQRELGEQGDRSKLDALARMRGFLAACRDCCRQWLNVNRVNLNSADQEAWERLLNDLGSLASIDPVEERKMTVRHLIRRQAKDLEWANPELRGEAITKLQNFALEFKAMSASTAPAGERGAMEDLHVALSPLSHTMAKASLPVADRAAAAEALGHIGGERAAEALIQMMGHSAEPSVAVRRAAAEALGLVEAGPKDPEAHWRLLKGILANEALHLRGAADWAEIDAKLPLLQGASRGLQRLAARSSPFRLPVWGEERGLTVPMLTLTRTAGAVTTRMVEVEVWRLPLPGGVPSLEVVAIPGGSATLGSPRAEEGREAYGHRPEAASVEVEAQREVTVPAFAMARFPITQAQWRSLAGVEHQRQGDQPLELDPSQHKGDDLPVECVSWLHSQEWIKRYNRWLREQAQSKRFGGSVPELALPSESLWEVSCRAGTDTPFHCGDTLDATWANFNATYRHGDGRAGRYLKQPTPVGAYGLVNDRGLADLHGNVWEWCADVWHPSPLGGPADGQAWMEFFDGLPEERQLVLLRGGSWFNDPHDCRF